ncbi:MAG: TetR/AcrR family transcriptional regulator [Solirubrobacterales bacterium]|nr:TetR/AcrR family transcriptional regulator [Solirubrobacterales bacterium]
MTGSADLIQERPIEPTDRIAKAALAQFTDFGIRRTSVEDIAARAGLSRVTVYRNVGSRDEVIRLVLRTEAQRAMRELDQELTDETDPEATLEIGFAFLVRFIREHPLFDRLLKTEPETLLPSVTVEGGPFLDFYRELIADSLRPLVRAGSIAPVDLERAAEGVARLAISLILTPSGLVDADDPDAVAAFARDTLLPMLKPQSGDRRV